MLWWSIQCRNTLSHNFDNHTASVVHRVALLKRLIAMHLASRRVNVDAAATPSTMHMYDESTSCAPTHARSHNLCTRATLAQFAHACTCMIPAVCLGSAWTSRPHGVSDACCVLMLLCNAAWLAHSPRLDDSIGQCLQFP